MHSACRLLHHTPTTLRRSPPLIFHLMQPLLLSHAKLVERPFSVIVQQGLHECRNQSHFQQMVYLMLFVSELTPLFDLTSLIESLRSSPRCCRGTFSQHAYNAQGNFQIYPRLASKQGNALRSLKWRCQQNAQGQSLHIGVDRLACRAFCSEINYLH